MTAIHWLWNSGYWVPFMVLIWECSKLFRVWWEDDFMMNWRERKWNQ